MTTFKLSENRREDRRRHLAEVEDPYEEELNEDEEQRQRDINGRVLIRGKDVHFGQSRQGFSAFYIGRGIFDTVLDDWTFFRHDVKKHSGKHKHQGGLVLFIIAGDGYSTVNGATIDWKQHDLVMLPIIPEQCEHQHFNRNPGEQAIWCAIGPGGLRRETGGGFTQSEASPDFGG